jgi:hypothetical protein
MYRRLNQRIDVAGGGLLHRFEDVAKTLDIT